MMRRSRVMKKEEEREREEGVTGEMMGGGSCLFLLFPATNITFSHFV